jgi:hypothetical protein
MHPHRLAVPLGAVLAVLVLAGPAYAADPCVDDHTGDASVVIRGRVGTEKTLTAETLRSAVAAGTLTGKTESVTYNTGNTPTHRTYTGVALYDVMTKLAEPLFSSTIKNAGLRYFVAVTGADAYQAIVGWGDLDPNFGNRGDILLAYDERDDDAHEAGFHSLAGVGPRLIVPGDVRGGRYVSCVRDLRLGSSDDSNGIVQGPAGPQGPTGPQGARGPQGPKGDRGKPGRDAKVTCTVKDRSRHVSVSCNVRYEHAYAAARVNRIIRYFA